MKKSALGLSKLFFVASLFSMTGCSTIGNILNPFYDAPTEVAYFGEKNDNALNEGGSGKAERARAALDAQGTYQSSHSPQPVNPVLQPAVVRLMWIPDHLNSHGDMVPAHYYYLRVLQDRWALQDAFELEAQLGGSGGASSIGYALPEDVQ